MSLTVYLKRHLEAEQEVLEAYQRLVDDRPDDIISYLIRTIVMDESRHHELFTEILNSLQSKVRWEEMSPRVPPMPAHIEDGTALLEATDHLLEIEQDDAKELKRLRKAWAKSDGERGLWALLVGGAELDTERHIRLLKYLRRLLSDTYSKDLSPPDLRRPSRFTHNADSADQPKRPGSATTDRTCPAACPILDGCCGTFVPGPRRRRRQLCNDDWYRES